MSTEGYGGGGITLGSNTEEHDGMGEERESGVITQSIIKTVYTRATGERLAGPRPLIAAAPCVFDPRLWRSLSRTATDIPRQTSAPPQSQWDKRRKCIHTFRISGSFLPTCIVGEGIGGFGGVLSL